MAGATPMRSTTRRRPQMDRPLVVPPGVPQAQGEGAPGAALPRHALLLQGGLTSFPRWLGGGVAQGHHHRRRPPGRRPLRGRTAPAGTPTSAACRRRHQVSSR